MTEHNPFAEVIAALKRERAEIDQLIAALERRTAPTTSGIEVTELDETTFHGWAILDASKEYLKRAKKALTAPELAEALQRGGIKSESANFTNTVYTTLKREHDRGGDVIKLPGRKWGLTDDWPQAARKRASAQGRPVRVSTVPDGGESIPENDEPIEPEPPAEQSPSAA